MIQELAERRAEFRFPIVIPVEYYRRNGSIISSYSLDISKNGAFVSSDEPLDVGSRCALRLTVPIDKESSKVFGTEATVTWSKILPFKSTRNGMGIRFSEPFPENLLLNAIADNTIKLTREAEVRKQLEGKVEKLESALEESKRLVALGRCVEKILFELSNPILTLSGQLEIMKAKMAEHKRMLEEHEETHNKKFKKIVIEFDTCCTEIDRILKDYKIISELEQMMRDDGETLDRKLRERLLCS